MSDRYRQLVNAPIGRRISSLLALPRPAELRRHRPGDPVLHGPALVGGPADGRLHKRIEGVLDAIDADRRVGPAEADGDTRYAALLFDATACRAVADLHDVYAFFHRTVARTLGSARIIVLGTPPDACDDATEAATQRALDGLVRSLAKELRGGATANLVMVDPGAEEAVESTLRFLLSGRSAYVNGQPIRVGPAGEEQPAAIADWDRPLDGQLAVVTGAARGIGEAIAETVARDGATVVCLDLPAQGERLTTVANRIGGTTLQLDITADDAPAQLASYLRERHGGVDILVHNAGVTRDKTIVGMDDPRWDLVLDINLAAQQRIDEALLERDVLNRHGRIVTVSSVSGIAGNRGQTNYAASKAGLIGRVHALAPALAERRATINAVAPGFIETEMTDEMPFAVREIGRRMNSLAQGGLPVDVAETIAWLASPASAHVNGQVVRVCGQSLIGA
jgi:3-oxoacyl-[acyl-carrier protein] reductase